MTRQATDAGITPCLLYTLVATGLAVGLWLFGCLLFALLGLRIPL